MPHNFDLIRLTAAVFSRFAVFYFTSFSPRLALRFGLLGPGSSDNLLGPKDSQQKASPALLDARELLKHFTSEGQPAGELQPLAVSRG